MRLTAVINMKGGCGKSTIATHLASAMVHSGMRTALADMDRQKSATTWLDFRPEDAARIAGVDWTKTFEKPPKRTSRLIVDCPAAMRGEALTAIVKAADAIVIPILASVFDERSTERFLKRIEKDKGVRKGRTPIYLVANRYRPSSRAAKRLEDFIEDIGWSFTAHISERAVYGDLAVRGLALFDVKTKSALKLQEEWMPLVKAVDQA